MRDASGPSNRSTALNRGSSNSVLVVDDDRVIRQTIGHIITRAGFTTAGVSDGAEALAYLRSVAAPPCLIILDLNMPVMSGWEFRELQLHDPALRPIPVAVISSDLRLPPRLEVAEGRYLRKPIDFAALLRLLAEVCP